MERAFNRAIGELHLVTANSELHVVVSKVMRAIKIFTRLIHPDSPVMPTLRRYRVKIFAIFIDAELLMKSPEKIEGLVQDAEELKNTTSGIDFDIALIEHNDSQISSLPNHTELSLITSGQLFADLYPTPPPQ